MRLINKEVIERAVIDTLKNNVLTEENIRGLIDLVLDEINQNRVTVQEELGTLDTQLETLREKLGRLYAAIETGKINIGDLAPRIKELKNQMDILEIKKLEVLEKANSPKTLPFDPAKIKLFVEDLCALLRKGTLVERKGFLRTFIKRIDVHPSEAVIEYCLPLKTAKGRTPHKRSSAFGTVWLPALDGFRTTGPEVVLLIKLYKHRKRGNLLSLGEPFLGDPP